MSSFFLGKSSVSTNGGSFTTIHHSLSLQEATQVMDMRGLPPFVETEDLPRKKLDKFYRPPTPELIAYLDFTVSTTGVLSGVKVKGERHVHAQC